MEKFIKYFVIPDKPNVFLTYHDIRINENLSIRYQEHVEEVWLDYRGPSSLRITIKRSG